MEEKKKKKFSESTPEDREATAVSAVQKAQAEMHASGVAWVALDEEGKGMYEVPPGADPKTGRVYYKKLRDQGKEND